MGRRGVAPCMCRGSAGGGLQRCKVSRSKGVRGVQGVSGVRRCRGRGIRGGVGEEFIPPPPPPILEYGLHV